MTDALVLLVVAPIVAALLPLGIGLFIRGSGQYIALAMAVLQVALSLLVLEEVLTAGAFSYDVAGYAPPFGIELIGDGVSAPLLVLIASVTLAVVLYSFRSGPQGDSFYGELAFLTAGLSGLVATGDVFNLYVFLEITGLATYALVASDSSPAAAYASLKYLIVGTIGASFYLLGVGYLLVATGTLNMADLASSIPEVGYTSPLILAAFGLIVVGLGVKVALFPLHTWQPDAYAESPHTISAHIAALVSTAAAYALFRIVYGVFTVDFLAAVPIARDTLLAAAGISVIVGAVLAVVQRDLKRMLAYSSVSHFGLVVLGVSIGNETALAGGLIHLVGHGVMKAGLFLAVGVFAMGAGVKTVQDLSGLGTRYPITSAAFGVLAFSMVGVPPAIGFPGKWNIIMGAVQAGEWIVAVIVVTSALLTLGYFGRLLERLYFTESITNTDQSVKADGGHPEDVSVLLRTIVVVAALAAVGLGFWATELIDVFQPVMEVYFT
ncbi:monovalent cation/H+ antiporter subunit D [Halodesulfurarchaeum formicicum]|uniref:Monovalent cation/H+ antiporter subunit D n=1 Tax=Halodesulfurarchaeum formicicum TaxID=1873524 RepID=A0A1D8S4D9_9EURY|nr:monovalent cation/H+ antiporter subunit D family protein [Halodesulfurarchaeum formicicum]AOW80213.1 monovalent cation/H+ antiporter subunit D [Halodesulfurarchaeum formicicum]APE95514.1 monovalent cation/H+ antiporter subunit D [Halodesulfurarchaeum formicicum]